MLKDPLSNLLVMTNIKLFFLHPLMLAMYMWVILIFALPDYFKKYSAEIISVENKPKYTNVYYQDLNGDGRTELIETKYNSGDINKDISVQHFNIDRKIYNQWYAKGKWLDFYKAYFNDYDNNGFKEIYFLSIYKDSIFLNAKELMLDDGLLIKNRFVCLAGTFENSLNDIRDIDATFMDTNGDGYDEFIFAISGGFSKFPRNTFRYNIIDDNLTMSPKSASGFSREFSLMDMNGDGLDEITAAVGSPENIHYKMPYTDSSSWLMVINPKTMNFLFPPKQFKLGIGSETKPFLTELKGKKYIAISTTSNSAKLDSISNELIVFDNQGILLSKKQIRKENFRNITFFNVKEKNDNFYLINNDGSIYKTDLNLELTEVLKLDINITSIYYYNNYVVDIDGDGKREYIYIGANNLAQHKLLIYNSELSNCLPVDLTELRSLSNWNLNIINSNDEKLIMIQAGTYVYKIDYHESPYYSLKYPAYISMYLLLFLLFWLLQKGQNMIAAKAMEEEKKLMKQQMALSKKQLEPHFMLNTLNNIGNMFAKEEKEDAQYYFGKFSSLLHRGLLYADKTETTLLEELEFVKDYLSLQQRRFEMFYFTIEASEEIDLDSILIPHSLIYTFVENALKHGLRDKVGEKKLDIKISKRKNRVSIIIRDNGVGRKGSNKFKTSGTGKGLSIIENIIGAYNKLNNRKISFEIFDMEEGTKVIILV